MQVPAPATMATDEALSIPLKLKTLEERCRTPTYIEQMHSLCIYTKCSSLLAEGNRVFTEAFACVGSWDAEA